MNGDVRAAFRQYIRDIQRNLGTADYTEHTHRPALKALLEALGTDIIATNEPKRIECGAPLTSIYPDTASLLVISRLRMSGRAWTKLYVPSSWNVTLIRSTISSLLTTWSSAGSSTGSNGGRPALPAWPQTESS